MFAYPSQRLQDWLSQQWCILTGRRIEPAQVDWLMGPYGHVDVIEDRYVEHLVENEGLTLHTNPPGAGLVESTRVWNLDAEADSRLHPRIAHLYEHTLDYEFEVWSEWKPFFRPFAGLIKALFSRRIQQLNLPSHPLDTARGIRSQIYKLVDPDSGEVRYTVWYRHLKSTQEVIYSGVYTHCTLPDGQTCLKVIFPLPRGNATVVMKIEVKDDGSLLLVSQGEKFGDPGFYFLLQDAKGQHWARYLPSFHESIWVNVDDEDVLRADHVLNLWGFQTLHLHYRMNLVGRSQSSI